MGNKILTVEINADTGKFEAKIKDLPKLLATQVSIGDKINELEKQRLLLIQEQQIKLSKLSDVIARTSNLNEKMQLGAVNASLVSANKHFETIHGTVKNINSELQTLKNAANLGLGSLAQSRTIQRPSQQFGTVAEKRQAETEEQIRRRDFSNLSQNIFRPKSDTAIRLTQGLSEAGRLAEVKKQEEEFAKSEALLNGVKKKQKYLEDLAKSHRSLAESVIYSTIIYKTFTNTLNIVSTAIANIPKVGIELESTRASLTATVGSTAGMYSVLEALNAEAERTGINIGALRENFRTFQASTSLAGESLEDTWQMFSNINTVSTALHLNTEKTIGIFNALAQIFNKSKVQSEELVKQLGNLLPGAFASFQKANSDMFKSTQDLIAQMQKGAVFAHDTIKNFTDFLANRFGSAFAIASQGLNANIGRLQSSFILLQESIYNTTSGPMNAFVKGLTSAIKSLTAFVEEGDGLNKFIGTLAGSLGGLLVGTIINKVIPAIKLATASTVDFRLSLISLGSTAVLATLAALEARLFSIGQAQAAVYARGKELAEDFASTQAKADRSLPLEIRVEADKEVKGARQEIERAKKELAEIRRSRLEGGTVRKTDEGLLPLAQAEAKVVESINIQERLLKQAIEAKTLEIKKADQDALNNIVTGGVNISEAIEQVHIEALRAQGKNIEAAGAQWDKVYKDKVQAAKDGIEKATAQLKNVTDEDIRKNLQDQIATNKRFIEEAGLARQKALDDAADKQKKKEDSAARRESGLDSKIDTKNIQLELEKQQTLYDSNIISYARYFEERKAILEKGIKEEEALNRGKQGQAKIIDYEKQIEQLQQDRFTAAISKAQELRSIDQEYYQIIGDSEKALTSQQQEKYVLILNYLREQVELGNEAANEGIRRVNIINSIAKAEASVADARQQSQAKETQYQQALERINILKNTGALSELQANREIDKQNEQIIRSREEAIAAEEKVLEVLDKVRDSSAYRKKAEEIRQMRAELENFKLTANTAALFIENTLGKAFENAFVDFATGTVNATQAFQNFTKSIIAEIAKLAAQEARSAIVGGLLKSAFSGIMGMFGSGLSTVVPKTVGLNLGSSLNLSPIMQATGGINTGMGIGNGVVLSSATYFPQAKPTMFASGGVVAGEAGYEAALPLKRTRSGKLGVSVEGQQQAGNVVTINVSVDRSKGQNDEAYAAMIAEKIARKVSQEEIAKNARNKTYSSSATKYG